MIARIAALMAVVAAGTNIPVPLLLVYEDRLAMSPTQTVGLFGVYAAGLVPAILVAGPVADRVGRRAVALVAVAAAALLSIGYLVAGDSVALLYVVRCLQGAAAGAVFTVATTWLLESSTERTGRGPRLAAVAMTGGFSAGSLLGGVLGQWAPHPLVLSYAIHAAATVVVLAFALRVPETRRRRVPGALSSTLLRPGTMRTAVLVLAPPAVFVFGFPAIAISALPVLVGLPVAPVAATGILASLTLGSGAVAAPWQRRLGPATVPCAALLGTVGLALAAAAAAVPALAVVMLPASVALGAGGGLALSGGLARLPAVAMPARAATVSAGFYSFAYLGFGLPALLSWAAPTVPVAASLAVLSGLCLVVWRSQREVEVSGAPGPSAAGRPAPGSPPGRR